MARWLNSFWRQAFVASGASLNLAQSCVVLGYAAGIMPQLKKTDSPIPMDDEIGSWVVSVHGFTYLFGTILASSLMEHYGRRVTNILIPVFALSGWICVGLTNNLFWLLLGRIVQGFSMGLSVILCPIMIGECSSPRNRGVFLTCQTVVLSLSVLSIHTLSSYLHWRTCALVYSVISFMNLLICIYSPESPSWLASQGRYEDCMAVFRWLRGNREEEELQRLIEAGKDIEKSKTVVDQNVFKKEIRNSKLSQIKVALQKKEVYKPIIIATHLCTLNCWCGLYILLSNPNDIIFAVAGKGVNIPLVIVSMDVFRFLSNTFSLYTITRMKRKTMLLSVWVNILIYFSIAGYSYVRNKEMLSFDDQNYIAIILIHAHMVSIGMGSALLTRILLGEIFPLEYRSASCGFSNTIGSISQFLVLKTFTNLLNKYGISGCYLIYGVICTYCLIVVYIFLPETKDRTLQDIEDEFKNAASKSKDKSGYLLRNVN